MTSEGLLRDNEVTGVQYGDPGRAWPSPTTASSSASRGASTRRLAAKRNFVATASCGICGKASIDDVAVRCEPLPKGLPVVARSVIVGAAGRAARRARRRSSGRAACTQPGLFETDGRVVAVREDVGRHNALDKLIGSRVRARELPLWDRILMVSGRVSFEIVQKAAVAGVPIICAVSAPSDLAVRLADRLGVTLVGFLRGDSFNVYTHDGRVDLRDLLD